MKKKILSLALIVAMMAAFVPFYAVDLPTVSAASENSEDFVIEDGVLLAYDGEGGDVVIPDSVTEIVGDAFDGCDYHSQFRYFH